MDVILAASSFTAAPGISHWGTPEGEVAHSSLGLAKGLRGLGHRVSLIAPLAPHHADAGLGLARRLSPLAFTVGGRVHERIVHDLRLASGVEVVLLGGESPLSAPEVVARECGSVETSWAWFGHALAALSRQRLGAVSVRGAEPELEAVLCIGETTAFSPLSIREAARAVSSDGGPNPKLLAGLSRLLLILDPCRDLRLPRECLAAVGVPDSMFVPDGVEFYGQLSLVKSGVVASDRIVALGDAPRAALVAEGAAHRFDGVFRARGSDLVSIGSGIDQAHYNPATDPLLIARFDAEDTSGKSRNRSTVLTEAELESNPSLPVLAVIGQVQERYRTAVLTALGRALRGEVVVVVALSRAKADAGHPSDREFDEGLDRLCAQHPRRIRVIHNATEVQLHRALAAADFALLTTDDAVGTPARAALRFGTVPIAVRTPAYEEAIVDVDPSLATGTGLLTSSVDELAGTVQRALTAHRHPGWSKLVRRSMRVEGGWERAARRLEAILFQLEA